MANRSLEIVIGIDFGTTYSGVAWAVNSGARHIRVVNNWRNPQGTNRNEDKTPSVITAGLGLGKSDLKWGYEVGPNDRAFHWTKILLEPNHRYAQSVSYVQKSKALLTEVGKTAVEVVAEYLEFLWDFTMEDIEKTKGPDFRDVYSFRVVLSVPAMWSPAAKDRTLQAAFQAGFDAVISLVTEPEAAAHAILKDRAEMSELNVNDCFVVCDAGGGTVDLISYEIEVVRPLTIRECAIGTGDLCGSIFIDDDFQKWVTTLIGQTQWDRIAPRHKQRMFKEFNILKCNFQAQSKQDQSVDLKGVEDDVYNGIQDDTITVQANVMRTVFDPVCLKIVTLIERQIEQVVEKCGRKPKAILLVGGFGQSDYLHNHLKEAFQPQSITVMQTVGAWSAICRGATIWGLEHGYDHVSSIRQTVSTRLSRYSYGIILSLPWDKNKHQEADKWQNKLDGQWYAANQMRWLIKRGDKFQENQSLPYDVFQDYADITRPPSWMHTVTEDLFFCEDDKPPQHGSAPSIQKLCSLSWKMSVPNLTLNSVRLENNGQSYLRSRYTVSARLGNAILDFSILLKGQKIATCEASYPDT